ncbi:hypothetical protein CDAR_574231 [Caerostris darwini]|uniref:Uncharacterized protein n=1 Tax=Caerostris darwini TaxID=1538125 RepID=A0AAV4R523_9ARAC|nr:hypothetical protein CDAR_574231 [Caerostris darwini]
MGVAHRHQLSGLKDSAQSVFQTTGKIESGGVFFLPPTTLHPPFPTRTFLGWEGGTILREGLLHILLLSSLPQNPCAFFFSKTVEDTDFARKGVVEINAEVVCRDPQGESGHKVMEISIRENRFNYEGVNVKRGSGVS